MEGFLLLLAYPACISASRLQSLSIRRNRHAGGPTSPTPPRADIGGGFLVALVTLVRPMRIRMSHRTTRVVPMSFVVAIGLTY